MRKLLVFLLATTLLVLTSGCGEHLAGTNDARLEYHTDGPTPIASTKTNRTPKEELRARVVSRLGAEHVTVDADSGENGVILDVDRGTLETVDEALVWRGGLAAYRPDPSPAPFAPKDMAGLVDKHDHLEGPPGRIVHAIRETPLPPGHRMLARCIDADCKTYRTVAVLDPAARDFAEEIDSSRMTDSGRAVEVRLKPTAAHALHETSAAAPLLFARARAVLYEGPVPDDGVLTLSFGKDIYSYSRAARVKSLLDTPPLPVMHRVSVRDDPPAWGLALVGIVVPMILSFGWIFFVRRFDRAHPEPMWLVLATFALGGLSVVPAGLMEYACMSATPYLNPSVMNLGGQLIALPIELVVFTLVVGVAEEGSKFLAAWSLATHRKDFDEPVDGIVYGAIAALGFAAVENVKYFAVGRLAPTLIAMRSLTSVPGHMFFGAIWGYALGQKLVSKKTSVFLYFLWAATMHGAFDTFLSIGGLQLFSFAENLLLATLFILFLRSALRHGVVKPGSAAPSDRRLLYAMGSSSTFALWAIAMHVLAFGVVVVGGYFESTHRRVSYGFLSIAASMVALFGLSAHGVASSLPLDVAIDEHGVTFAGSSRRWETITGFERKASAFSVLGRATDVWIRSTEGDLHVGPGRGPTMEMFLRTLTQYVRPR